MNTKRKISGKVLEYTVTIHRAEEGGFWAEVPALAGCFSQGESVEDSLDGIREAIESHLEALKDEGSSLPRDRDIVIGRVAVSAPI